MIRTASHESSGAVLTPTVKVPERYFIREEPSISLEYVIVGRNMAVATVIAFQSAC